ncbi:MAG TPA: ATP-binding protein [Thermoanaerobaculia bacterium]|nr:ATP-binding protein [Thermoanaerobaculia bacterium]
MSAAAAPPPRAARGGGGPAWAAQLVELYESQAASQFVVHGNVTDRLLLPAGPPAAAAAGSGPAPAGDPADPAAPAVRLGGLTDFFLRRLLPRFDVVLSYDLGSGLRVEKGGELFTRWPGFQEGQEFPRAPRPALETVGRYFRYCANLARIGQPAQHVALIVEAAHLVVPADGAGQDVHALALLLRDWSSEELLTRHPLVSFLVTESFNDLHPLLATNPRAPAVKVPLPEPEEIAAALELLAPACPTALAELRGELPNVARELAGASLAAIESLLKVKEYRREPLRPHDLVELKKQMVETELAGLIEFVPSRLSFADLYGQEKLKAWLRQDLALWRRNEIRALPRGYLLCGPVGTGKTYLAECLAGEAGVPVVKIKNFRDKWVGTTEGNLEKIFRLLRALGRCFVFIDEADQTLGKRESGTSDSGLSGRVYSMIAQEMSNSESRGRVIWILASSRPDLIEVDLKRPGRIDLKIPLFPTTSPEEGFHLIRALCKRYGVAIEESAYARLQPKIPELLTPAAAETLAFRTYRTVRTDDVAPLEALERQLAAWRNPVPRETLEFQIALAVQEASDLELVPEAFRGLRG